MLKCLICVWFFFLIDSRSPSKFDIKKYPIFYGNVFIVKCFALLSVIILCLTPLKAFKRDRKQVFASFVFQSITINYF